jgi:hypothetical protein
MKFNPNILAPVALGFSTAFLTPTIAKSETVRPREIPTKIKPLYAQSIQILIPSELG